MRWELFDLSANTEGKLDPDVAFSNKTWLLVVFVWVLSEDSFAPFDHLPPGHRDVARQQKRNIPLPFDYPSTFSSAAGSMKEGQWEEQREASSALAFNLPIKEEQKEKDDEVACSAFWKGTSFSIIHLCIV